ncbi:MAG: hypothetical protein IKW35_09070 [Paludibacteraceae bacterium]|nr:hypothetical protein [Paludibacteraceae bacterium]
MKHNLFAILMCIVVCFSWMSCESNSPDNPSNASKELYIGVVAFNQGVRELALTKDLRKAKSFINDQKNDKDFTSFAYAVSKGNMQFDAAELPTFDNIFMLNFSDGTDNYSNMKWGEEGRIVAPNVVYDEARKDLLKRVGLNSYAIGFGNDVGFGSEMKKVVTGSGRYYNAKSSSDLRPTFNEIAKAMLTTAKNVVIKTNPGYYTGYYKYFRLSFKAEDGSKDVIYAQMEGTPNEGYTLSISKIENGYAYFDAPAKGIVNEETGKVHIPLNNLKFVKSNKELQFNFSIEVSFDGEMYYTDVEEASTAEQVSKHIAVVLVLDCSTSMGNAFAPMKEAAIDFIEAMEQTSTGDGGLEYGLENGYEYVDLGLSVKWATCNVGASKPEEYGDYFAWGETTTKTTYKWSTYKYCNGSYNSLIKYNTSSSYGTVNNKITLEATDDAARVNLGGSWRMPTKAEEDELRVKCKWNWTTQNGVKGYKVTSKSNGNSIFLPAAGYHSGSALEFVGNRGYYWSSSLYADTPDCASVLYFYLSYVDCDKISRSFGQSVRAVCP